MDEVTKMKNETNERVILLDRFNCTVLDAYRNLPQKCIEQRVLVALMVKVFGARTPSMTKFLTDNNITVLGYKKDCT